MKPTKKVALLHDLCGVGKAAATNMIPILSVMGIEACPIPTMLLSSHTGGYGKPARSESLTRYIIECADHYEREGVTFDLIFIGYLGSQEMVDAVRYFLSKFKNTTVLLDPIMGDHGVYYRNFDPEYGKAVARLIPFADILLPNLTEVFLLNQEPFKQLNQESDIARYCRKLEMLGASDIVVTSVPWNGRNKGIALYEKHNLTMIDQKSIPSEYHGTGDAFDGVFVGELLKGMPLIDCIRTSHDFVCECMMESEKYGYDKREGLMIEKNLYMLL